MIIVVHLIYYHHYSIALHVVADVVLHHNYFVNIKFYKHASHNNYNRSLPAINQ